MQYSTILAILATATSSLAAPLASAQPTWTIQDFQRTCATDGTSCNYSYAINTNDGSAATKCTYTVTGTSADPAARKAYQDVSCGNYRIGSTWSGQFGADHGFQTLSVINGAKIVYPAYTDAQLASGGVVKPDQSYEAQPWP